MSDPDPDNAGCPEAVLRLIPRYPELDEAERGLVEAHAAQCAACFEQTQVLHGDLTAPPVDEEQLLVRTMARIALTNPEGAGGRSATWAESATGRPSPRETPRRRRAPLWGAGGRGGIWATAAAVVLALAAGATLGAALQRNSGGGIADAREPVYETAIEAVAPVETPARERAQPTPPPPRQSAHLEVVFRSGVAIDRVTQVLRALGGEIVGGPTSVGRYSIALPAHSDATAVARMLRDEKAGVVAFAEPALE